MTARNNQITAPRVDFLDQNGKISREWYMYLYNLYTITGSGSGVTPIINGGTGIGTLPTNGQLLIGNDGVYSLNTLGAGTGVSVTNGPGTIVLANTGVLSNIAGTGISVSSATGNVTIANTGVLSVTGTSPVVSSGGATPAISLASGYGDTQNPYAAKTANYVLAAPNGSAGTPTFRALVAADIPALPYGTGTVTSVSFTGGIVSVATATTTPALTVAGTSGGIPYFASGTTWASSGALTQYGVVYGGGAGAAPVATAAGTTGQVLTATTGGAPTWAAPATSGTVTSVSVVSANGFAGTVATATTTPAITLTTSITGLLKGNGTAISAAVANTDYVPLSTVLTKTADYTITNTDTWIINNKTGSAMTLTFPAASAWTGRSITVKNMQAQLVNSASSNIVPIDSTTAGTAILLAVVGNWATMVSDGTNWVIMQAASNNNLLLE
jgi:hypothetical protein